MIQETVEFQDFIFRIGKVCPEAADYLNDPVIIKKLKIKPHFDGKYDLNTTFTWTNSVQGHGFWNTLHKLVDYS